MRSTHRIVTILASFVLVTLMSSVAARPAKVKTPEVKADTKATFEVVSAEVRKQMASGGRFEFVSSKEHAQVDASLDAMGALFDKYDSVAGMDQDAKVALFNDQEAVNVRQRYEAAPGVVRETFGTARNWQSPRHTQLVVTWNF